MLFRPTVESLKARFTSFFVCSTGSSTGLRYNGQTILRNVELLAGKHSTGALYIIVNYYKA